MSIHSVSDMRATRFNLESTDRTSIAVWVEGEGPALVLVHGSIADHTTFDPFVAVLRRDLTTFSMDRRGFGVSGDTPDYSIEQDFADVAAVVDAVAARTGGPVPCGATLTAPTARWAAPPSPRTPTISSSYEPSLGIPYPPGSIEAIEAALREATPTPPSQPCSSTSSR